METRSAVNVIARMQLWTEGEREAGFSDLLSIDVLKIAELFEKDKFIGDLKGSLIFHQEKKMKSGKF